MRLIPRALFVGGLGLAASFLVACGGGGSGLLSSDQASSLNSQLDQISAAVSSRNCAGATSAISTFSNEVNGLSGINPTLRDNLTQDAAKVSALAVRDCQNGATTTPTTATNTTATNTTTNTNSTSTPATNTGSQTTSTPANSTPATTPTNPGTSSTGAGSGGAGIGGGGNGNGGASGGAGAGNGNGQ